MLTLTEAAEQTGKSKSTLIRAIKTGRLSANRNEHGDYRVEPSELFRVYDQTVAHHGEPNDAPVAEAPPAMVADLLDMVKDKDSELAEVRAELDETRDRLTEHRDAARQLMSPEDFKAKLSKAIKAEKAQQAEQEQQWKKALSERKQEIEAARNEAAQIREREQEQTNALKAERARVAALESRGLIARLLNKKPEPVG